MRIVFKYLALAPMFFILHAGPASAATYRCEISSIKKLSERGVLEEDNFTRLLRKSVIEIYWDEEKSQLRKIFTELGPATEQFSLLQSGDEKNGSVGMSIIKGPASTVVSTIELHTFIKGMPFLLTESHGSALIYTGNCRLIK